MVKTYRTITILILLSLLTIPGCYGVGSGYITSEPQLPLIAGGIYVSGALVKVGSLPVEVPAGLEVCVKQNVYVDVDRRYSFKQWSDGVLDICRVVRENETVKAVYSEQVLIQVFSDIREYSKSFWIDVGETVNLTVPEVVEKDNVIYRFIEWSGGEEPWSPRNHFVAVKPMRLEVEWEQLYKLTLTSSHNVNVNGSGYYKYGSTATISAPSEVYLEKDRKLVFERWVSIGSTPVIILNEGSEVTAVRVEGSYIIKALYSEMYYVEFLGLGGEALLKKWVKAGETIQVSARQVIDVGGDARYVFKGWSDPSLPQIPSITLHIDKPMKVQALYEKQYRVELESSYGGSGGGWYPENSTAVLRAPENPQTMLLLKIVFDGWAGDIEGSIGKGSTLIIRNISRPIKVQALYSIQPDYTSITVIGALVTVLTALGLREKSRKKREYVRVLGEESEEAEKEYMIAGK